MTEYRLNAYHIMWLFVFFDLPVSTKKEMKAAALFRKNLEKDGFSMMQFSVLLGSGLLPNLGIFHKSRYNAFPLADDVMEPYRPYVDSIVFNLYADGITELNKDSKMEIMRLLSCDVKIGKVMRPLQIALTFTTASLVKFYAGEIKKISLPFIL